MSQYVMDSAWELEHERLELLESWADRGTIRILDDLGVGNGWCCLEVGAGAGSIARWLCGRVGPEGRVVATDIDTRILEGIRADNLIVQCHDIVTDALPDAAYELVHVRAVLEHLPQREQVLHRIVGAVRPGGWLVVEDQDITSVSADPGAEPEAVALFDHCAKAMVRLLTLGGVDLYYGRRLFRYLARHGLTDVRMEGRTYTAQGGSPLALFWRRTWEQLGPRAVHTGVLTSGQLQGYLALHDDPSFAWLTPMLVAAWGRRQLA